MALQTTTDLNTMDYAYLGNPYTLINKPAEGDTKDMDLSYLGNPFVLVYSITTSTVTANSNFFMFF